MQSANIFLGLLFAVYVIIILVAYFKSKKFFKLFFLTALQGVCALFAVNLIGKLIAVHISVNAWTLGISAIGGASGVIMLLLCDSFL